MTSAFHFMGTVFDSDDNKIELEFHMTVFPPSLKFTVYLMGKFTSYTLNSERFDFKSRASPEDLDSRRDWLSAKIVVLLGDVFILEPLESRGKMIELSIRFSWDPCFAIIRWQMGSCHCHVAVRPSPPYRTWVRDNLAPVTWHAAVSYSDKVLDNLRTHRKTPHEPSSSSAGPSKNPPPVIHHRPTIQMLDSFCQADFEVKDSFCQTFSPLTVDFGVGPDLIHLITDLARYRSIEDYHPLGRSFGWPFLTHSE